MRACKLGSFSEAEGYMRRGRKIASQTEVLELARVVLVKANGLRLRIWALS